MAGRLRGWAGLVAVVAFTACRARPEEPEPGTTTGAGASSSDDTSGAPTGPTSSGPAETSGESGSLPPDAVCEGLGQAECEATDGCSLQYGSRIEGEGEAACLAEREVVGCMGPRWCHAIIVYACHPKEGTAYRFGSDCHPRDWDACRLATYPTEGCEPPSERRTR